MSSGIEVEGPSSEEKTILHPPSQFFPELLRRAQNMDGGWGYRPGSESCTEPTAWSILALRQCEEPTSKTLSSALGWLQRSQMPEGGWPTGSGKDPGCWVTALACLALLKLPESPAGALAKGIRWLCDIWPAEGNLVWRLRQRWQPKAADIVRQNHSLRGWGWTPETASWVEPTAYAMILLQNIPEDLRSPLVAKRTGLGEKMLYDRACPGGGWNAGNPLVYGVPGVPRVGPTVWALLALRSRPGRTANAEGLTWLEQNYRTIHSAGAHALAQICLKVYGRPVEQAEAELSQLYSTNHFLQNVPVMAWASLAVSEVPGWLERLPQTGDEG